MLFDVLLDGDGQRMDGVHLSRSREQDGFLLRHAARRLDERDLRHADRQRARLVEHDRIRLSQRLDVVAALDQDAALGCGADGRRDGRGRRELQAAGEVDEQQVEDALPVPCRTVDDGRTEEGDRDEEIRHLVGEVLHRCLARLRLFDEVDDMREARILADLLDGDDEFACLHDRARVDRRTLVLHGRVRLARNGCLIDGGIAADDAAIDDDLLAGVRGDDVAGLDLLNRHLALDLAVNQPDVALVKRQQAGNLRAGALCCIAREHLGAVGDGQQRQARFRLAGEHRGNDGRGGQRIGIRAVILDHALDAVLDELACNREHEQAARDFHAEEELR